MSLRTDTPAEAPQLTDRLEVEQQERGGDPEGPPARPGPWAHARVVVHQRRRSLLGLGALLVLIGLAQGVGMYSAPQRIDDEGTYTAQAWAIFHLGELTHYTYWYDHPPLGWLQLAGYAAVTSAFERAPYAVAAGREFMLVLQLISTVLLWVLARRIGLPRWGAAIAVALFGLSPLAIQFHRTVYLDNIATPWMLAAFVMALTPRRRLVAFSAAGLLFAIAVLTKETSLLLLPVLAWALWRNSAGETRRYAIAVSATVFALAGMFYVLLALLKGEVLPGPDRTSLVSGLLFQLADRSASGSVFTPGTLGNITVQQWLQLDVVLPALSLPAALLALAVHRLRPFAVGFLLLVAMIVRPGYLLVPFVIAMIPLAALLIAGVAVSGWEHGRVFQRPPRPLFGVTLAASLATLTVVVGAGSAVAAAPRWFAQQRGFVLAPLDRPMVEATGWVQDNVPRDSRILTDDALWVDLVDSGFARENVVWFYKPDTDPAVITGWQNYDWVISTDSMRTFPTSFATVTGALQNSTVVASFGAGDQQVEVRRVTPGLPDAAAARAQADGRAAAARALSRNPALGLAAEAREALLDGKVDGRLLTVLAVATATHTLEVNALPTVPGEESGVRRTLRVSRIDGRPVAEDSAARRDILALLRRQDGDYRSRVELTGTGENARLTVTFPAGGS